MIGTIFIEALSIRCIIGVNPDERVTPQEIFVDCELDHDFAAAAERDDVAQTMDYAAVASALTQLAQTRRFQLLETFAEVAAALVIERFAASRVAITIRKPAAIDAARFAGVRVERRAS